MWGEGEKDKGETVGAPVSVQKTLRTLNKKQFVSPDPHSTSSTHVY